MSKIICAHQPNFMPYLGFFDKAKKSDILVIRDEVLFVKKEFINRNRIRINGNDNKNNPQSKWINIPVIDPQDYILHVAIKDQMVRKNLKWNIEMLKNIKINYERTAYFEDYYPEIERILTNTYQKLIDLNMELIRFMIKSFSIKTKIFFASELNIKSSHYEKTDATKDLINICKKLDAEEYISGTGGKSYLKKELFEKEGIKLSFQDFKHPEYKQGFEGFIPNMSAIDGLFCAGKDILNN